MFNCFRKKEREPSFIKGHCISAYVIYSHGSMHEYLLLRRAGEHLNGTWQMISGGVEENEKAHQTGLREIFEETGLVPDRFYSADCVETFYLVGKDLIAFVPVFVGFVDEKRDVKLSSHEHDAYEWLSYENAKERLVFSEQKRIISIIHEQFVLKTPDTIHLIKHGR